MSEGMVIALIGFLGAVFAGMVTGCIMLLTKGFENKSKAQIGVAISGLVTLFICSIGAVVVVF